MLDAETRQPVEFVGVSLSDSSGATIARTHTDSFGAFSFAGADGHLHTLIFDRDGYGRRIKRGVVPGTDQARNLIVVMIVAPRVRLDPVVVTVSRRAERGGDAPAAVSVVGRRAIKERPAVTPIAHVRAVAGLDVAATGLTQSTVVARGFGSAQSAALLPLVDYRYANLPALRYALLHFLPTPDEDVERIEVLRGPGAAVYGPNSDRGVVHVITRSAFDGPTFSGSIVGGEREIASGSFRYARRAGGRWAFKVGGQYFRGRDWRARDSVEAVMRMREIEAGADSSALLVGRREARSERVAGEATLEWRGPGGATAALAAGQNRAVRSLEITPLGAAQVRDWAFTYVQLRGGTGGFFGQVFLNASDAGDTYWVRTGDPIRDESRLFAVQAQQRWDPSTRLRLTGGVDAEWTDPRTNETITGRNEDDDRVRDIGGYGHAALDLGAGVRAVGALRLDNHDRLQSVVLSPRAAVTYEPSAGRTFRLTYNRAFGTPSVDDLFADLEVGDVGPFYKVHVSGVPASGFHFPRAADGSLLMQSPFPTAIDDADRRVYRPVDATLYWDTVVASLQADSIDLTGIPAPTSADIGTVLRAIEGEGDFRDITDVPDLPRLEPTITNSVEVGFRGLVTDRIRIDVEFYRTWIENFIGHLRTITPSVFLDRQTLYAYLIANGMADSGADSAATKATEIPVGTVTPLEARDPADLIKAVQNFGSVAVWGSEITAAVEATDRVILRGTFSWVSQDEFLSTDRRTDLALNAPGRKGSLTIGYRDPARGLTAEIRGRAASSFPVLSGIYSGIVESYAVADLGVGLRVGRAPDTRLDITVENAIGGAHHEFLAAPKIGRLALARLSVSF